MGDSDDTDDNQSLLLGYSSNGQVIHSHSGAVSALDNTSTYSSSIESYENSSSIARVFTFMQDSAVGKKTYINGTLAATSTNVDSLFGISNLVVGKGYKGQIGEIIIFSKALKDGERKSVEDYLSKKWSVKNNGDTSPDCTGGVITSKGCIRACPVRINGISVTQVLDGANGTLLCNSTGYINPAQQITYSCNNGTLSLTPSSPTCPCDTINGYALDGTTQTCKRSCTVTGTGTTSGITPTTVIQGNGTLSCNSTGYNSAISVSYTCSGGVLSTTGTCNSCASSYAFAYDGTCKTTCSVTGVIGVTSSPVAQTSGITGSLSCNDSGYSGSVSYGCDSSGNLTSSGTCSCTSGYAKNTSGFCKAKCGISAGQILGMNATSGLTILNGSGTLTCNATGYVGTLNYTCDDNQTLTITSGQCAETCSGGTVSTITSGGTNYKLHIFNSNNTFSCLVSTSIQYLVVGGGGGGGGGSSVSGGGGGGAGGYLSGSTTVAAGSSLTVTVGSGGGPGSAGGNSSLGSSIIAYGGGKGAYSLESASNSSMLNGGSGGGGSGLGSGGSAVSGQGNIGATGYYSAGTNSIRGGGGGGSGGSGTAPSFGCPGNGGSGKTSAITGTTIYYAGGGGGGHIYQKTNSSSACYNGNICTTKTYAYGDGGNNVGGKGADGYTLNGGDGVAGTGSGGGGSGICGSTVGTAGSGGSGVVIIRYSL